MTAISPEPGLVQALSELAADVDRRAERFRLPLDVAEMCDANGLQLSLEAHATPSTSDRRPPAEVSRLANGEYRIVLRRDGVLTRALSPLERFFVAHEIAHVLIDRRTAWLPTSRREYYARERWCDQLARRLLVPRSVLRQEADGLCSATSLGFALNRVARRCAVPREAVARRIREDLTDCFIFCVARTARKNLEPVWQVVWSTGRDDASEIAPRKMFNDRHPIAEAAAIAADRNGRDVAGLALADRQLRMLSQPGGRVLGWISKKEEREGLREGAEGGDAEHRCGA